MRHDQTHARRRLARALGGATLAVALTATAACGGSGGDSTSSASSSSSSSGSSSSSEPLTKSDLGDRLSSAIDKAGSFTFTLQGTAAGQATKGEGKVDLSGSTPLVDSTSTVAGQEVQTRIVDGVYYLKSAALVPGGKWLKIDPKAKSGIGALLGQLGGNSDPSQQLKALSKATSVTPKGTEEIDGTATRAYEVEVPGAAYGAAIGFPETLAKELPDTLTYTVNVDDDDLLRRLESSIAVRNVKTETSVTFSDFGDDVSVSAPPAGQTTTKSSVPGLSG
ncbi:hypothetical protein GCM10011519_16580 [Marmoricola endophyticus]|uniref:LppX_LprAFG lipoprotein n=1 Tax=Marmoricola endophyticus TaxID=2040280 RepID=A0A917BIQ4_9ACTN|nr:LppX_LprAFG lipoprotein [Marmoricola endophyticus]GGF43391.1 hypothetical protein GCM10011519_16580 [Marmoricola endophyticus]